MPDYFGKPAESRPPRYFKDVDKPKRGDWKKHERDVEKRSGDRRVSGSGNQPGCPGDNMGVKFLREDKTTKHAGITISAKWLEKLVRESLSVCRVPLFDIRLEGAQVPVPTDWVLLPADDFQEIIDGSA